jgi:HTH-type transcriptional regulator / antitoxin HigA
MSTEPGSLSNHHTKLPTHETFKRYLVEDPPHPGEILAAELEKRSMSQVDFAARTGFSAKHVNQVLKGSASLSPDSAVAIERVLGIEAGTWMGLDARWQEHRSRRRRRLELDEYTAWADRFPRSVLVERGFLPDPAASGHPVEDILDLFQVADPAAFERVWLAPLSGGFKRAQKFSIDELATATWLLIAERQTAPLDLPSFNLAALRKAVRKLRAATTLSIADGFFEARKALAACGVALTFVGSLPGSRVVGATWWPALNRPIIALSERHQREDIFWFALFHEVAHILLHPRREAFVEFDGNDNKDGRETEADNYAATELIPSDHDSSIIAADPAQLPKIAEMLGVGVAIVAGRRARITQQWSQMSRYRHKLDVDALCNAEQRHLG